MSRRPRSRVSSWGSSGETGRLPAGAAKHIANEFLAELRAAVALLRGAASGAVGHSGPSGGPGLSYRTPLDLSCEILIRVVRRCCPGLLPPDPLDTGTATPPI